MFVHTSLIVRIYIFLVKEDYSDQKRRRTAVARPKSPSATPPPSREEVKSELPKGSRQQGGCVSKVGVCVRTEHIYSNKSTPFHY